MRFILKTIYFVLQQNSSYVQAVHLIDINHIYWYGVRNVLEIDFQAVEKRGKKVSQKLLVNIYQKQKII